MAELTHTPHRPKITPVNSPSEFDVAELFFSTTDRKGIIVSGNAVFVRVSGWHEDELVGAPHNIIRHPDMPRAVFQLLWQYLGAGRPIAAYVKNMAKDGRYYWVLATAVPLSDGYLSVRLKPTSDLLATVEPLYAELLAAERAIEEAGGKPAQAMAASSALLMERLGALGFDSYDAFMRVALPAEIRARQAVLSQRGAAGTSRLIAGDGGGSGLAGARDAARALSDYRYSQFRILERYEQLHDVFLSKTEFVLQLADNVRLFSLNAQIGAARLADAGAALGVIADIMRLRSDSTARLVRQLSDDFASIVAELAELSFGLSVATLQSEMTAQYIEGLVAERGQSGHDAARHSLSASVRALSEALRDGVGPALGTLTALAAHLGDIGGTLEQLQSEMRHLDALQVAGRVESARLANAGEFRVLFEDIRAQIGTAREQLEGLAALESIRNATLDAIADASIMRSLERLDAWAARAAA
ncbi:MAG: PAS domain-containing protein [Dehalococcoidia bacterium]